MSTPTQPPTTTPFGTKPVGNDSQDHSAPNAMVADREIHTVVAFNHHPTEIYMDHSAVDGDVILVDISSSIAGPNAILLRTAVAAMTKGTNSSFQHLMEAQVSFQRSNTVWKWPTVARQRYWILTHK